MLGEEEGLDSKCKDMVVHGSAMIIMMHGLFGGGLPRDCLPG